MEIFRALGALAEVPRSDLEPVAAQLELGPLPARHEHTELFGFQLVPYASVYLSDEGRVGGEARDRVLGFWRALGREPDPEGDQITLLLASYAELCAPPPEADHGSVDGAPAREGAQSVEAAQSVERTPSVEGVPSVERASSVEGARHRRHAFLHEHLLSWLPAFLVALLRLDPPFYRDWASILWEALAMEAERLGDPPATSIHHRLATPFPDSTASSEDLLTALLAPMRSGVVITRRDLSDAARELGIASRMGERRYMLEAMLHQRPEELVRWLAGHCDALLTAYAGTSGPLGRSLEPWTERARITRDRLGATASSGIAPSVGPP